MFKRKFFASFDLIYKTVVLLINLARLSFCNNFQIEEIYIK